MTADYSEWTLPVGSLCVHTDWAAHAGASQPAIPRGILGEILLVIFLRVIKRRGVRNFSCDPSEAGVVQPVLKDLPRCFGRTLLLRRERVDRGTILSADVVSLPHALRRIMVLPENLEQRVIGRDFRIEHDEHDLGVTGHAGAHLAVGRIRRVPTCISDGGGIDTGRFPELPLGTPEASHREHRLFEPLGKRRHDAMAVDKMGLRYVHCLLTASYCLVGLWHPQFHVSFVPFLYSLSSA